MARELRGGRARLRGAHRGVLEGLPLSLLISIIVIAIGSVILIGIYTYAQGTNLGSLTFSTPLLGHYPGYLTNTSTELEVTAWAAAGSTLGGVTVILNGTGVTEEGRTSANGTVLFWVDPIFREHATSGIVNIEARYLGGASFADQHEQTYTTTLLVLA